MVKTYRNPVTNITREITSDSCIWTFFLGFIYYFYKGMFAKGMFYLLIELLLSWTIIVPFIVWIWCTIKVVDDYSEYLEDRGFVLESIR